MLKTNTKKARENMQKYILDNFRELKKGAAER